MVLGAPAQKQMALRGSQKFQFAAAKRLPEMKSMTARAQIDDEVYKKYQRMTRIGTNRIRHKLNQYFVDEDAFFESQR